MKDADGDGMKPTKSEDGAKCHTHTHFQIKTLKCEDQNKEKLQPPHQHADWEQRHGYKEQTPKKILVKITLDTSGSRNALMIGTLWAVDEASTL